MIDEAARFQTLRPTPDASLCVHLVISTVYTGGFPLTPERLRAAGAQVATVVYTAASSALGLIEFEVMPAAEINGTDAAWKVCGDYLLELERFGETDTRDGIYADCGVTLVTGLAYWQGSEMQYVMTRENAPASLVNLGLA